MNEFETARVNKPPGFEPLKFYCMNESVIDKNSADLSIFTVCASSQNKAKPENSTKVYTADATKITFVSLPPEAGYTIIDEMGTRLLSAAYEC